MRKSRNQPKRSEKPHPKSIPLPIIQNEQEEIDQAMQELFDEDKVIHEHGQTQPERD